MSKSVSIIIPYYKSKHSLIRLLEALKKNDLESTEIIVVDDHSEEDMEDIRAGYPVRVITLEENSGPAAARNRGAAEALGEVLFFMDSDIIPPGDIITTVMREFSGPEQIDVLCLVTTPTDPEGNFYMNYLSLQEDYWVDQFFEEGSDTAYVRVFTTRNGAMRKEVFSQMGGFDPKFRTNALEDYDFSSRFSPSCKVKWIREPSVLHKFPDSVRKICRNYFIRCGLYIDYKMTHNTPMDKVQTSRGEMLMRSLAGVSFLTLPAALFSTLALAVFAAATLAYAWMVSGLLAHMADRMGSVFAAKALFFHYLLSLTICAGGVYGFVIHFGEKRRC